MGAEAGALSLRRMTRADIPFGLKLSTAAGWNQTAADWRLILSQKGARGFLASLDDVPAGTVTLIPYQDRFRWVGMALVSADFRRRGIGTALLGAAIQAGSTTGLVRLDATPAGKKLYDQLGFRDEYRLSRMVRNSAVGDNPWPRETETPCQALTPELFPHLLHIDRPVFGADRQAILKGLYRMQPGFACAWVESNIIKGYCLGRVGARYAHIGPIVAEDVHIARGLLLRVSGQYAQQDTILDVPRQNAEWLDCLSALGFSELRPFIRMCYGEQDPPAPNHQQFAIAGPELG